MDESEILRNIAQVATEEKEKRNHERAERFTSLLENLASSTADHIIDKLKENPDIDHKEITGILQGFFMMASMALMGA